MNTTTAAPLTPEEQELRERLLRDLTLHYALGIACVPLCRPDGSDACTARWHGPRCSSPGKRPLVTGYPQMAEVLPALDHIRLEAERNFPFNPGMVVPYWAVVVEADSVDAEEEISGLSGGLTSIAPCRERRPGRGRGWIFRADPGWELRSRTKLGTSKAVDALAAGSIFVVGGAVHRSGHHVEWVEGRAPWQVPMPVLPPGLLRLAREGADRTPVTNRNGAVSAPFDFEPRISSRVAFLLKSDRKLRRLWSGEGKARGDSSASGIDYSLAVALHGHRVPLVEIAEAIAARPGAHSDREWYCMKTAFAAAGRLK